jgi:serine/threonine protein kinase
MSPMERLSAALGRSYRIERELGQGGMATVYLAEDLKHKRQVAIKKLSGQASPIAINSSGNSADHEASCSAGTCWTWRGP